MAKIGETITAEQLRARGGNIPKVGETISSEQLRARGGKVAAPAPKPEGVGGLGGFALGAGKTLFGQTALGLGRLGRGLQKGISSVTGLKIRGGEMFDPGTEQAEKFGKAVTPRGKAEQAGGFLGDVAAFAVPGGGIVKGGKAAQALVRGAGKTGIARRMAGLGARAVTEGAGFGGVEAVRQGEVGDDALRTAAISTAFPVAGGLVRKAKDVTGGTLKTLSDVAIGAPKKELLEKVSRNPEFFRQAQQGKVTISSVADDIVKSIKQFSNRSFKKLQTERAKLPNKVISTKNIDTGLANKIRSVAGLEKGEKITQQTLLENLPEVEAKAILQLLKRGRLLSQGKIKDFKGSVKDLDQLRQTLDKEQKRLAKGFESSEVFKFLRNELNKSVDKAVPKFGEARSVASKEIKEFEKLLTNLTGLKSKDIRTGDIINVEKVPNKVRQIINQFDDDIKLQDTQELLRRLDKAIPKAKLLDKFEGLVGHLESQKTLGITGENILTRGSQAIENLIFNAVSKVEPGRRKSVEKVGNAIKKLPEVDVITFLKALGVSLPPDSNENLR